MIFKGCRPAAELQNPMNLMRIHDFFENVNFPGSWERFNLVPIGFSSNLPQTLRQIVEYCPRTEPQTFQKLDFNTFPKKLSLIIRSEETNWGKMSVMTVGSFQVFIKSVTLTSVLQVRVRVFPRTSISIFSV